MLDLNPVKKLHRIKGNEPLLLNDPHRVWIVKSGAIALFAAKIQGEKPASNRHYLFSASAGEALFGTAQQDRWGILAVPIAETELEPIAIADFCALVAAGEGNAIALLDGWMQRLGEIARSREEIVSPETVVLASAWQYLSLETGQLLRSPPGNVVWVRVSSGECWRIEVKCRFPSVSPGWEDVAGGFRES